MKKRRSRRPVGRYRSNIALPQLPVDDDAVRRMAALHLLVNYAPDQPRDDAGQFSSGGAGFLARVVGSALHRIRQLQNTVSDLRAKAATLPLVKHVVYASEFCKDVTHGFYSGLESRYGKATAVSVMATGQKLGWGAMAKGVYLPMVSVWGSLPAAAVAEVYLQVRRGAKKLGVTNVSVAALAEQLKEHLEAEYSDWLRERAPSIVSDFTDGNKDPLAQFADHLHNAAQPVSRFSDELLYEVANTAVKPGAKVVDAAKKRRVEAEAKLSDKERKLKDKATVKAAKDSARANVRAAKDMLEDERTRIGELSDTTDQRATADRAVAVETVSVVKRER